MIFDGARNPAKGAENKRRKQDRDNAAAELDALLKASRAQDRKEVFRLAKKASTVREDVVALVVAWARGAGIPFVVRHLMQISYSSSWNIQDSLMVVTYHY